MNFLGNLYELYLEAAPWLLLGLVVAGLIKAWLPTERLNRWLGGRGIWPVVKAAFIGAPLPLCSCGVLPAALGLRRAGASKPATLSFLIATPETGPDSIALSYALLGPFMAIIRPLAALFSAIFTGLLALLEKTAEKPPLPALDIACSGGECCAAEAATPPASGWKKTLQGQAYAFSSIVDDLVLWLGLGLLAAALVATFVPPLAMAEWGSGWTAKLLMLVVGIPMYVCATASTPIAAGLLLAGISPGTVLVFLLAGPATNLGTLAVVRRELGGSSLIFYLGGITIASLAAGISTDWLASRYNVDILAQLAQTDESLPHWLALTSGLLLALTAIKPLREALLEKIR